MSDIVSFEDLKSIDQIEAQSAGLIRIVLEGQDDAKLFSDFWFTDYQDRFAFVAADRLPGGTGGSHGVITAVQNSRAEGVMAYGIIDRDTLFRTRCWSGLYEPDTARLHRHTFDPNVYTSQLWEVEAYVLDEPRLRDWVEGNYREPPASAQRCDAALGTTLGECELLLGLAPAYAALHVAGCSPPGPFTQGQSHAAARNACQAQLQAIELRHQVIAEIVAELVDAIRAAAPADAAERLAWYLRYVDTKRLFTRLTRALDLNGGANHWQLAVAMKRRGDRPREFQDHLDRIAA
jgi:hypothetical protein